MGFKISEIGIFSWDGFPTRKPPQNQKYIFLLTPTLNLKIRPRIPRRFRKRCQAGFSFPLRTSHPQPVSGQGRTGIDRFLRRDLTELFDRFLRTDLPKILYFLAQVKRSFRYELY